MSEDQGHRTISLHKAGMPFALPGAIPGNSVYGGVERVLFLPNLLMKIFNYVPSLIHLVMKSK
jgi:hypothetical protein